MMNSTLLQIKHSRKINIRKLARILIKFSILKNNMIFKYKKTINKLKIGIKKKTKQSLSMVGEIMEYYY